MRRVGVKTEAVLTDEERLKVCEWIARFHTIHSIQQRILSEFGKSITYHAIEKYRYSPKWYPMIARLREQWSVNVMEVPIAHKRQRAERLEQLWQQVEQLKGVNEKERILLHVSVLREAREEMQATKQTNVNVMMTSITQYTDQDLLKRRDELIAQIGGPHALRRSQTIEASPSADEENGGRNGT